MTVINLNLDQTSVATSTPPTSPRSIWDRLDQQTRERDWHALGIGVEGTGRWDQWLTPCSVCPGDMTRYDLALGYNPERDDAPWFVALTNCGGRATWVNLHDANGPVTASGTPDGNLVVEAPHVGYLLNLIAPDLADTWGPRVVAHVAGIILVRRAFATHSPKGPPL